MPHSKKLSKKTGMVLTEALVAVSTMAMGVVALGSITTDVLSTTILSKDYLVMEGLLDEANEVVKNINYTNWLLKPADKKCWLRLNPNNSSDANCTYNAEAGNNYIVVLEKGIWQMKSVGADLDLDKIQSTNDQFQVYLDSAPETFGYLSALSQPSGTKITKSKFFRSVKFNSKDDDVAAYTVKMQWKDGAKTREVSKTTTLYNY